MTEPASEPGQPAQPTAEPSGVLRTELLVSRAVVFFRIGGLIQIAAALALGWRHYRSLAVVLSLVLAVAAEGVVLIAACLREGRVRRSWIGIDVGFCCAALAVCAAQTSPANDRSWINFMYPFTIITCFGIGTAYRRLPITLAVTAALAASYTVAAVILGHEAMWNVMPNSATYFANTAVAWAVTRELCRSERQLDLGRAEAVAHAGELARERERVRHARILHDRVLQTLEVLTDGPWLTDSALHRHVAADAAWLRALVQGRMPSQSGDLLSCLHALVQEKAKVGLNVQLNCHQLGEPDTLLARIPGRVTEAVVAAVAESLTNVGKHAGVDRAVVQAALTEAGLAVSVLDHGAGFCPAAVGQGIGLRQSIGERIREIDGDVRIESVPGEGTCVEITVPAGSLGAAKPPQGPPQHRWPRPLAR